MLDLNLRINDANRAEGAQTRLQAAWEGGEAEGEGPAARALRTLQQQVARAAEEATAGNLDEPPPPPKPRSLGSSS